MTLVDSTVWIDLFDGVSNAHTVWLQHAVKSKRIGLTDLILCEVLQGFRSEKAFRSAKDALLEFKIFETGGEQIALASVQNYRFLQSRGKTIRKTIDCLIATFCLMEGHSLLHHDRDFDLFERHLGLIVIDPHQLPPPALSLIKKS
jgi:predicted nucleic acid-binding protein